MNFGEIFYKNISLSFTLFNVFFLQIKLTEYILMKLVHVNIVYLPINIKIIILI